jgi:hypothetical protein
MVILSFRKIWGGGMTAGIGFDFILREEVVLVVVDGVVFGEVRDGSWSRPK